MISFVSILLTASLFIASPDSIEVDNKISSYTLSENVYVSNWERNLSFREIAIGAENKYSSLRTTPQLTQEVLENGAVLVFIKGYEFVTNNTQDKPLQLPFYIFSSNENVSVPSNWQIVKSLGALEVGLNVPDQLVDLFKKSQNSIQFRYFILDESFIKRQKLTRNALQRLNYQQLVQLVKVAP